MDTQHYIKVKFETGYKGIDTGPFLLEMERLARKMLGVRSEVFLDTLRDQNKLRQKLTTKDVI